MFLKVRTETSTESIERILLLYKSLKNNTAINIASIVGINKNTVGEVITRHIQGRKGYEFQYVVLKSKMNKPDVPEYAKNFKNRREKLGFTKAEVSRKTKMNRSVISVVEDGGYTRSAAVVLLNDFYTKEEAKL